MIEQISFDNGIYNIEDETENFDIEFDIMSIEAKFRMLSRGYIDKYAMKNYKQNEHIIYILIRENRPVYVGQSIDSISRINQHKYKNKCNFDRCFIFSKPRKDLRAFIDYMEKYLIYKLEMKGVVLENSVKLDPKKDILNESKKILSQKWMNTFVDFLPTFGVSCKSEVRENIIIEKENIKLNKKTNIKIYYNNILIEGKNNKQIVGNFFSKLGIDEIVKNEEKINSSTAFLVKKEIFNNVVGGKAVPVLKFNDDLGKEFYLSLHISTKELKNKINKIIKELSLENVFVK